MSLRRLLAKHRCCGAMLALCVLVAVLWAGSYRSIAHLKLPVSAGATRWECTSYRGILCISLIEDHPTTQPTFIAVRRDTPRLAAAWDEHFWGAAYAGFSIEESQALLTDMQGGSVVRRWSAMNLPYWLLLALAGLGPLRHAFVAVRAYRRATHGRCGECGYELGDGEVCQACAARAVLIGASSRVQLVR